MGKRVFHACQGVAIDGNPLAGVQNLSVRTSNDTHVVDNFGSLGIAGVYADNPTSTITLSRVLNASADVRYPTNAELHDVLPSITTNGKHLCLFIGDDTQDVAGNTAGTSIKYNNIAYNRYTYNFVVDGNFTEDIEIISNEKIIGNNDCDIASMNSLPSGADVARRQMFSSSYNLGEKFPSGGNLQSLTIDIPFNIQTVQEFGKPISDKTKKYRYATMPVEITVEATIQYTPSNSNDKYDNYSFSSTGILCDNATGLPSTESLSFGFCSGITFQIDNCILNTINYDGGGTDGSHAQFTYSYSCYNQFKIASS